MTNRVSIKVCENRTRWCNDIVRVDFEWPWYFEKPERDQAEMKQSFNYGSGGWNEGFTPAEQLTIASQAMAVAAELLDVAEQNKEYIYSLLKADHRHKKLKTKLFGRIKNINIEEKANARDDEFGPFLEEQTRLTREDLETRLYEKDHGLNRMRGIEVRKYEDGIALHEIVLSREKYSTRATYMINDDRAAGEKVLNYPVDNIVLTELISPACLSGMGMYHSDKRQILGKVFHTVEELKIAVAEFVKQYELI
jgi:hypothetical protein